MVNTGDSINLRYRGGPYTVGTKTKWVTEPETSTLDIDAEFNKGTDNFSSIRAINSKYMMLYDCRILGGLGVQPPLRSCRIFEMPVN